MMSIRQDTVLRPWRNTFRISIQVPEKCLYVSHFELHIKMILTLHESILYDKGVEHAPVDDGYPEGDCREAGLHAPGHRVHQGEGGGREVMGRKPPTNNDSRVDQIMESQKTNTCKRICFKRVWVKIKAVF